MRAIPLTVFAVLLLGSIPVRADEPGLLIEKKVSSQVVATVEKELDRLKAQQKEEEEKNGLGSSNPSGEVAYLLLQGLAAQSTLIAKPSAEDIETFSLAPKACSVSRLYDVNAESRRVAQRTHP